MLARSSTCSRSRGTQLPCPSPPFLGVSDARSLARCLRLASPSPFRPFYTRLPRPVSSPLSPSRVSSWPLTPPLPPPPLSLSLSATVHCSVGSRQSQRCGCGSSCPVPPPARPPAATAGIVKRECYCLHPPLLVLELDPSRLVPCYARPDSCISSSSFLLLLCMRLRACSRLLHIIPSLVLPPALLCSGSLPPRPNLEFLTQGREPRVPRLLPPRAAAWIPSG